MASIYRSWRVITAGVPEQDTPRAQKAEPAQNAPPPVHLRRAQPVLVLLPRTARWIESLPPDVQPRALAARYARIANVICAAWEDRPACRKYLAELLIDRRGGRKGFPPEVTLDIETLLTYHGQLASGQRD